MTQTRNGTHLLPHAINNGDNTRKLNQLDNFLLNNDQGQTQKRSTSHRNAPQELHFVFPQNKENALGVGNYPMNTFMKGNELSRSPSRNAIGRRPMISPKKTDRPVSNLNGKQNSSANRMLKSSKGSKANKQFCENHENKQGQYHIVIDGEDLYYCEKCAAKLASQGFNVRKATQQSNKHELSRQQPNKSKTFLPKFSGNPCYEQLMAFLRDLGEVEQRKGEAITKLDSLASQVGQNNAQVRQLHNNLSSILENAISQHLAKLNEQQNRSLQMAVIHKDQLQEDGEQMRQMRQDIEGNIERIVIDVEEDSFRQCADGYNSKLQVIKHRLEEQQEFIGDTDQLLGYQQDHQQEILQQFAQALQRVLGLELGQSESRPKIPQRGVSTVKQTLVASHGLQEKSLDESLDRSPFRNLFEGEAHESSRRTVARYPSRKN